MHTFMYMVEYSLMTSVSKEEVRRSFETKRYCYRSFVMIATKDQVFKLLSGESVVFSVLNMICRLRFEDPVISIVYITLSTLF